MPLDKSRNNTASRERSEERMLLRGSCDSSSFLLACVRREGAPGPRQPANKPANSQRDAFEQFPSNITTSRMHFTQLSSTALAGSGSRGPLLDDYSLTSWMRNTWSTLHLSPLRVTCLCCRCWTPQVSHVSLGREICMGRIDTLVGTRKQLTRC